MPIHQSQLHILSYDISEPKRLRRVHRRVRESGVPLQYSVFLVEASRSDLESLLADLDDIIDPVEDDIRVYPLPTRLEVHRYGRQHLPAGVALFEDERLSQALTALVGTPQER